MRAMYLFCGLTGSGKSTLASKFAKENGLAYLDYDTVVQPFLSEIEKRYGIGASRAQFYISWREACYKSLWDTCAQILSNGASLVVSAPCGKEIEDPSFFATLKAKAGFDFTAVGIYLAPEKDFHFKVMKQRNAIWNDDIIPNWESYCKTHRPHRPVWDADRNIYIEYSDFDQLDQKFRDAMDGRVND